MWERVHFLLVPDMPDSIRRVNQAFNHPGNKVDYSIIYIYTIILYIYICVCVYFHSCCMRTPKHIGCVLCACHVCFLRVVAQVLAVTIPILWPVYQL